MNECLTPECGTASKLYLCENCIRDLAGRLEQGKKLIPELGVTIARLDSGGPRNPEGGHGTKSASSAAPLDLNALQVQMDLEEDTRYSAVEWASDPWTAQEVERVIKNIVTAESLISGPEEQHVDHAGNRAKVKEVAPPMIMRELLPWLRTNARMAITSQAVRNWVHRGLLTPASRGTPAAKGKKATESTYHPHEVIDAWHKRNNKKTVDF